MMQMAVAAMEYERYAALVQTLTKRSTIAIAEAKVENSGREIGMRR
jgi:hypothetical protein